MPANFVLTLTAPKEYGLEVFDTDASIWLATDINKTSISRYTDDPIRDSVMMIQGISWTLGDNKKLGDNLYLGDSISGVGEGSYKDFTVTPGIRYAFSCFAKVAKGSLNISFIDLTNSSIINSIYKDNYSWKSHESSIIIPHNCVSMRIAFLQSDKSPGAFYIDDISLNGNVLLYDPDNYSRIAERIGNLHETLSGRRIYDLRAIHYSFDLGWNFINSEQYEGLRELYYSNELLYFNDGNVPPLAEREIVYETDEYNYNGITNPSNTHKAYFDSSPYLPIGKSDFENTEFSNMDYEAIALDDDNSKISSDPGENEFLYHKFLILSNINSEDIRRFRVKISMSGSDSSPQSLNGGILYAYQGSNWVELARSTNSGKVDLTYTTTDANVARQFVDTEDNYIRLLLRSRNRQYSNLSLQTFFIECEINENLNLTIDLSHKAILDENDDVIYVKNLTQEKMLALGTDYSISNDRRRITVSNQSSGDEIEVKYNRYFEVMFASIPEEWLNGDPTLDDKARSLKITLNTISESK